jgi:arylsulfatase A-like enzyme
LHAAPYRPPNVFLLVVDSLRRDYLSPYNPEVTFTPNIARLAADSDVFDRAFTRYAGTYMSVQSIWAGGLPFHATDQPYFERRDTLRKLLTANGYVTLLTRDHVVGEFLPAGPDIVELARGRKEIDIRACSTLSELETALAARDPKRPVFFWSLPQDLHLGVMTSVAVPAGERYPGFFDKVASQLARLDRCVGQFVDRLKQSGLYDDSIVVLTADHGDLYGYEGRWGHANLLYPEVMRVPLIVHVPSRLRSGLRAETNQVAFLTDITPTLYRLLGYSPRDLGSLFGRSLFADAAAVPVRRDDAFLVASAYGAVYGVVRDNGRRMYVVDTIEGREYVADMTHTALVSSEVTPEMQSTHRALIRRDIERLSAIYRFQP